MEQAPKSTDKQPSSSELKAKLERKSGTGMSVEPDLPPIRRIFFLVTVLSLVVIVTVTGLWQLFRMMSSAEIYVKDLSRDNAQLREVRARERGQLVEYSAIDAGIYRIPVERAMDLLAAQPRLLAPRVVPGADSAAGAGAGAETQVSPSESKGEDSKKSEPAASP